MKRARAITEAPSLGLEGEKGERKTRGQGLEGRRLLEQALGGLRPITPAAPFTASLVSRCKESHFGRHGQKGAKWRGREVCRGGAHQQTRGGEEWLEASERISEWGQREESPVTTKVCRFAPGY